MWLPKTGDKVRARGFTEFAGQVGTILGYATEPFDLYVEFPNLVRVPVMLHEVEFNEAGMGSAEERK